MGLLKEAALSGQRLKLFWLKSVYASLGKVSITTALAPGVMMIIACMYMVAYHNGLDNGQLP